METDFCNVDFFSSCHYEKSVHVLIILYKLATITLTKPNFFLVGIQLK